ncbi:hypothetical protein DFH01_04065 [Falsiroseomonas bella]|uniref:Uncharacterized protein n=1 Tax=Falsiroseomonas bella TaxID=2184016 RepID=A0A317FIA8_9PROT|nr:hypothetical protein [Falsiroseomonas bella]PWS38465.1 hypothetical protein DFH01_04065 [Falsiroseomonas bella]
MRSELRRIVAAEAQRRRSGRCPAVLHALGTGESFAFVAREDGFVDAASGMAVRAEADRILLPDGTAILFALDGDVGFAGCDPVSRERFTGRGAAGASVTIYDVRGDHFQYATLEWETA